jgi:hypothetical protein
MERGVKVKWPSKRMSVGDMNKRVRALVEWVGREQASAMDRGRRRDALEKVYRNAARGDGNGSGSGITNTVASETNDGEPRGDISGHPPLSSGTEVSTTAATPPDLPAVLGSPPPLEMNKSPMTMMIADLEGDGGFSDSSLRASNMKIMEGLMEELISFQERFGPGAKLRERERRLATA